MSELWRSYRWCAFTQHRMPVRSAFYCRYGWLWQLPRADRQRIRSMLARGV